MTSQPHSISSSPAPSPSSPPPSCSSRRALAAVALGKRITAVFPTESGGGPRNGLFDEIVCGQDAASAAELVAALQGRTIVELDRRGKYMWWKLSGAGPTPVWHFGMTGGFSIKAPGKPAYEAMQYKSTKARLETWPPKFCKIELELEGGTRLAFTDPRRLGRLRLVPDAVTSPPVSELGPDALLELPPLPGFIASIRSRAVPIKALLLDQSFLAGVGNWIADEVLYQSALHPATISSALTDEEIGRLRGAIASVVGAACDAGSDDSKLPQDYLFFYRWGKGGRNGGGDKDFYGRSIVFVTVGGRTSAVVPAVQGTPRKTLPRCGAGAAVAAVPEGAAAAGGSSEGAATTATVAGKKRGRAAATVAAAAAVDVEVAAAAAPPSKRRRAGSSGRTA